MNAIEAILGKLFVYRHQYFPDIIFYRIANDFGPVLYLPQYKHNCFMPPEMEMTVSFEGDLASTEEQSKLLDLLFEKESDIITKYASSITGTCTHFAGKFQLIKCSYRDLFWTYTQAGSKYEFTAVISLARLPEVADTYKIARNKPIKV